VIHVTGVASADRHRSVFPKERFALSARAFSSRGDDAIVPLTPLSRAKVFFDEGRSLSRPRTVLPVSESRSFFESSHAETVFTARP